MPKGKQSTWNNSNKNGPAIPPLDVMWWGGKCRRSEEKWKERFGNRDYRCSDEINAKLAGRVMGVAE